MGGRAPGRGALCRDPEVSVNSVSEERPAGGGQRGFSEASAVLRLGQEPRSHRGPEQRVVWSMQTSAGPSAARGGGTEGAGPKVRHQEALGRQTSQQGCTHPRGPSPLWPHLVLRPGQLLEPQTTLLVATQLPFAWGAIQDHGWS